MLNWLRNWWYQDLPDEMQRKMLERVERKREIKRHVHMACMLQQQNCYIGLDGGSGSQMNNPGGAINWGGRFVW